MTLYCPLCGKKVAVIIKGSGILPGAVMVCAECLERYKIADQMAKRVRDQVQSNPEVEKLMGIFNMR